jgi:hypothetical protein
VTSSGFKALANLRHLRRFLFGEAFNNSVVEHKCLNLSAKFLPQLHMNGIDLNHFSLNYCEGERYDKYHNAMVQQRQPAPLSLQQVLLSGNVRLHESCQLPALQELHLLYINKNAAVQLCSRFTSFSVLAFYQTKKDSVMAVLQLVGQRISSLRLDDMLEQLSLVEILQSCPNLRILRIDEYCEFDYFCKKWPKDILNCLEEVYLDMQYEQLPQGFITTVSKNVTPFNSAKPLTFC